MGKRVIHHYRLLLGRLIQIFNYLHARHGRSDICDRLNKTREYRNRINHKEPICFSGNNINFNYLEEVDKAIIKIINWIDSELADWMKNIDSVKVKVLNAKTII